MRASVHVNLPGFKTKQSVKDFVKTEGKWFFFVEKTIYILFPFF
jgi:hypothetical protein